MTDKKGIHEQEEIKDLSLEDQQALLEKYDAESNIRKVTGVFKTIIYLLLLVFSLFQLYTAIFGQYPALNNSLLINY